MTEDQKKRLRLAIGLVAHPAGRQLDERRFALVEALLRDCLGEKHGVWRRRVRPGDRMS